MIRAIRGQINVPFVANKKEPVETSSVSVNRLLIDYCYDV